MDRFIKPIFYPKRWCIGIILIIAIIIAIIFPTGCKKEAENREMCSEIPYAYSKNSELCKVDMLFIVDSSPSMESIRSELDLIIDYLGKYLDYWLPIGSMPSIRIGVTSADIGVGNNNVPGCSATGDNGRFLRGSCGDDHPGGYIVDVNPEGCTKKRKYSDFCTDHNCTPENCLHEPGTKLVIHPVTGCPRCRNYDHEELPDLMRCTLDIGTSGCMYTQPLEAMRKALESNHDFLREDAALSIFFITNRDDCSVRDTDFFTQFEDHEVSESQISMQCFQAGVTCNPESTDPGLKTECRPRKDPYSPIYPLSRYTSFLETIKNQSNISTRFLHVAGIAGFSDSEITIGSDESGNPKLEPSCTTEHATAFPAVRIQSLIEGFGNPDNVNTISICSGDFPFIFNETFCSRSLHVSYDPCFPYPVECASITQDGEHEGDEIENGNENRDDDKEITGCIPKCEFFRIIRNIDPNDNTSTGTPIPHCLEVCPNGPCPGNRDSSLSYAGGKPEYIDFDLPVPECWYVFDSVCPKNQPCFIFPRREDFPYASGPEACCQKVPGSI